MRFTIRLMKTVTYTAELELSAKDEDEVVEKAEAWIADEERTWIYWNLDNEQIEVTGWDFEAE